MLGCVFAVSPGLCVCVSVIYSRPGLLPEVPKGSPMTLAAADLHRRDEGRERFGRRRYGQWKSQHHFETANSI